MYPNLYRGLNLKPEDLVAYDSPLLSFDGKVVISKGQIRLPIQAGLEVVEVDFIVVDAYSPFTAIVARLWLHTLGAVSSTLHQKVKYPSGDWITELNRSWRKLLYRVEALTFLDVPPLVVQVTNLRCGGMILCTAINHCLCDGIGTSQFLQAWAHITTRPNLGLPITPLHSRHMLKPRNPPKSSFTHPEYTRTNSNDNNTIDMVKFLQSQPLVPTSFTFTTSHILHLKRQCVPLLKCTTFEALASHTWRCWVKSLDMSPSLKAKLLFSVSVRKKMNPELPLGYYGNGFVLGCAQTNVKDLVTSNLYHGVKLVQQAKSTLNDEYIRSVIDLLEDKSVKTDLTTSLVISQWSKLGLEDLDFGEGKPLHMGSLTSDIYCLFLPVIGDFDAVRVLVSMPEGIVEKFEYFMKDFWDKEDNADANGNGYHGEDI
nr:fatty alcohol:caffeoyl-CoA acyltransferase-like [Quercus suber]